MSLNVTILSKHPVTKSGVRSINIVQFILILIQLWKVAMLEHNRFMTTLFTLFFRLRKKSRLKFLFLLVPSIDKDSKVFGRAISSWIHRSPFTFLVVDHHVGRGNFLRFSALPPNKVIESLLSTLEYCPFSFVQFFHEFREILIKSILRGIHYCAKSFLESLIKTVMLLISACL